MGTQERRRREVAYKDIPRRSVARYQQRLGVDFEVRQL